MKSGMNIMAIKTKNGAYYVQFHTKGDISAIITLEKGIKLILNMLEKDEGRIRVYFKKKKKNDLVCCYRNRKY